MLSVVLCVIMISVMGVSVRATTNIDDSELLDTHEDDGVPSILEKDDFETPEEYQRYLEEHPEAQIQTYAVKASPSKKVTAKATLRYKIKGLPSSAAIQKTYIGSTYIYVIQRSGNDSIMSRCTISGSAANYKDKMILKNFGHGQTLEWFEHKGNPYFWVTCKANTAEDKRWGVQIGRLAFQAGKTLDYTEIPRFSHMSYANKKGVSFGSVKRVDAALSSDRTKLLFWVKDKNNNVQYSYYNASKMNAELDKKTSSISKYVPCKESAIKSACYGSLVQTGGNKVLPHNSCQGLEFSNATSIYIAGGGAGEVPQIAKMLGSGSSYKYSCLVSITHSNFNKTHTEIEGLQLKGDYVYLGISDKSKEDSACIYSISKDVF